MAKSFKDLIRVAVADAQKSTHGWYRTNCPVCVIKTGKEDKRWSMGFQPETGRYKCFRCGSGGKLAEDFSAMAAENPSEEEEEDTTLEPPEGFMLLGEEPGLTAYSTEDAREYLLSRNVTEETWRACSIGITFDDPVHHDRIIVPILGDDDTWFGWVGRVWEPGWILKYRYPAGMQRGSLLWNHEALLIETDEPAMIVEGVFDGLPHYPYAVACLGKPSHGQIGALLAARRPLVVVLDGDAWMEAEALSLRLKFEGKRASFLRLPPRRDPGNYKPGDLLEQAVKTLEAA